MLWSRMTSTFALADALLGGGSPPAGLEPGALEAVLQRKLDDARAAWPTLRFDPEAVVRFWGKRLGPSPREVIQELEKLHLQDLALAWACADRQPAALAAFDRTFLERAVLSARRAAPDETFLQDVRQALRERLFVGADGRPPKIAEFSGRGPLARWLKVVALGAAVSLRRSRGARPIAHDDEALAELSMASEAPELAMMRGRHREDFRRAFTDAMGSLDRRERTLLRLHFIKHLTVDQLGPMYQVHRATAARWLAAARKNLLERTRRLLAERLALSSGELDSVIRDLRSQFDVTLSRVLGSEDETKGE